MFSGCRISSRSRERQCSSPADPRRLLHKVETSRYLYILQFVVISSLKDVFVIVVTESLDMNDFYDDCYDLDDEDSDYVDQDDEADGADDSGNENA